MVDSFDEEPSLTERQANGLRTAARTLDDLADIAEKGLPTFDPAIQEEVERWDITDTDTQFARTWDDIKTCVETHLEGITLDESLDEDGFDHLAISGHPPENRVMRLSFRYTQQGFLETDIEEP